MRSSSSAPVERVIPPTVAVRFANPVLTWLLRSPRRSAHVGASLLLLHVTGRKSGRVYTTPVGYHRRPDGWLLVLTSSGWRVNLRGGPVPVRLTLRGRDTPALATLEEEPEAVARVYGTLFDELGPGAGRRLGLRVNVDRPPTREELTDVVRRAGLSVVSLELTEPTGG